MRPLNIQKLRAIAKELRTMADDCEHHEDMDGAETINDMARHMEAVADVAHELASRRGAVGR